MHLPLNVGVLTNSWSINCPHCITIIVRLSFLGGVSAELKIILLISRGLASGSPSLPVCLGEAVPKIKDLTKSSQHDGVLVT